MRDHDIIKLMLGFRFITFLTLLPLALVLTFGVIMGMHTDSMGQMSDCPFAQGQAICQMGIFEHLNRFQRAFNSIPVKVLSTLSVLLFLAFSPSSDYQKGLLQKNKLLYLKRARGHISIFNTFLLAISDGIVQPKLFA
jgi:heme/copper-type cytochrome/quinol oxidase subunit 4